MIIGAVPYILGCLANIDPSYGITVPAFGLIGFGASLIWTGQAVSECVCVCMCVCVCVCVSCVPPMCAGVPVPVCGEGVHKDGGAPGPRVQQIQRNGAPPCVCACVWE